MKKFLVYFILAAVAMGCRNIHQSVDIEEAIINDAFVSIVDTTGYHYRTLRPAPNDSIFRTISDPVIFVSPTLSSISKWKTSIIASLNELKDSTLETAYKQLINQLDKYPSESPLDVSRITQTGRYRIISKEQVPAAGTLAGQVAFSHVYRDSAEQIGFLIVTISVKNKSGIVKVSFLQKKDAHWREVANSVLEVW